jgi:hypothetical protein
VSRRPRPPYLSNAPASDGAFPEVTSNTSSYTYDSITSHLVWSTDSVSPDSPSGSIEFTIDLPEEDTSLLYPIHVAFVSAQSLAGVAVDRAVVDGGEEAGFSQSVVCSVDEFTVV